MPRQEVIEELIDEKVKIKEAKKYGVDPGARHRSILRRDGARMRMTPDQLTRSLESQGIRPDTLKARLKADIVWTSSSAAASRRACRSAKRTSPTAAKEGGEQDQDRASNTSCGRSS